MLRMLLMKLMLRKKADVAGCFNRLTKADETDVIAKNYYSKVKFIKK